MFWSFKACLLCLSPTTPGAIGVEFLEPDSRYFSSNAPIEGKMVAVGLKLAIEKAGAYPRVGDKFMVITYPNGEISVFLGDEKLNIG